jgi:hypothetical protein
MLELLKNEYVRVFRGQDGDIQWVDLKDNYNDFRGYTRGKRNLEKATQFIIQLSKDERLKDDLKMGDITDLMGKFNLKPHTYCGMD